MNPNGSTQTVFPAIRYRDPDAAIAWLREAFGCSERVAYRDESGAVRHAELDLEGNVLMIGAAEDEGWLGGDPPQPLSSTVSLYVVVADPDARHDQAVAAGARIVRELVDESYGSREFSARDPEGNLWSFGTYRPEG